MANHSSHHQGAYRTNRMKPITNEERLRNIQGEVLRLRGLAMLHPDEVIYKLAIERVQAEAEAIRRVMAAPRKRTG